ncbi:hypothetical protein [Roseospira navarrensis]|uniref:MSP1 EGF domain 1 n=1 Tax=Roseospira navarrensis TaxID=140058 RepID=A0A7X2D6M7_9PROT|nr:hypothetical protein [Roseospira navarrensis]MQX38410.1 hypothetical protein [Roseospira navarrensis]
MHSFDTGALLIARSTWRTLVAAVLVLLFMSVAVAQDQTGPTPENAHDRSYDGGWDCDDGYRLEDGACKAIGVPDNAFATGRSYGSGWECRHGFTDVDGLTCRAVFVPPNAYLDATGLEWACDRGYRRVRDGCEPVNRPENSFLSDDTYGSEWECDRGYLEEAGRCVAIDVPENAFLVERESGPGWRCERGYEPDGNTCVLIVPPQNAHIDRSGNRWACNRGFRMLGGQCVLAR